MIEQQRLHDLYERARAGLPAANHDSVLNHDVVQMAERVMILMARTARNKNKLDAARNLLAILHADGGHHTDEVGFIQSCVDAEQVRHNLVGARDVAREELKEWEALFALQQTGMQAATQVWREATGRHDVLPDLGELLEWFIRQQVEAAAAILRMKSEVGSLRVINSGWIPEYERLATENDLLKANHHQAEQLLDHARRLIDKSALARFNEWVGLHDAYLASTQPAPTTEKK